MNTIELLSILARRFATRAMLVAVLVTAGCATERPAALAAGLTTPRTLAMPDDTIDPATSKCEAFGCEP